MAGLAVGAQPLRALNRQDTVTSASHWLPTPAAPHELVVFAQYAIDAAKSAGAQYADVRVGEQQELRVALGGGPMPVFGLRSTRSYGLRVLVDGVWGMSAGVTLDKKRLTAAAQSAVRHAKHAAVTIGRQLNRVDLAAMSPVQGEWCPTISIDPFTTPLLQHADIMGGFRVAVQRVLNQTLAADFNWMRDHSIVASSEGTLVRQDVYRAEPILHVSAPYNNMPNFCSFQGGLEVVTDLNLLDRAKAFAEKNLEWSMYPVIDLDVGRYPLVMDGKAGASHMSILARGCEADRVLRSEGDASGTSFLSPEVLQATTPTFSPLVTLDATATESTSASIRWDGEGSPVQPHSIIEHGQVRHLSVSRETAPVLSKMINAAVPVYGSGAVQDPSWIPTISASEVVLRPSSSRATLDDLIRDMDDGIAIVNGGVPMPDPALQTGITQASYLFQVKQGKLHRRVSNRIGLMMRTTKLWKESLRAVGDQSTMAMSVSAYYKGIPWQRLRQVASAPALLFADVDVVRMEGGQSWRR